MTAGEVIERIKECLENGSLFPNDKLKYKYDGRKKSFFFGISTKEVVGKINVFILIEKSNYMVWAVLNSKANDNNINEIAKHLHTLNYGLKNGNFELDFEDGEIRYKTFVDFENSEISDDVICRSILIPIIMIFNNSETIMKILLKE